MLHSDSQASTGLHMCLDIDVHEIFECAHLKFMISGQSKQASKSTHTHVQCGDASVGFTQACPNYYTDITRVL